MDYTPSSSVSAGQIVVIGNRVAIAKTPIAANALGSLALEGVFEMTKAATTAIAIGVDVYTNGTVTSTITSSTGGTYIGKTWSASAGGSSLANVIILPPTPAA